MKRIFTFILLTTLLFVNASAKIPEIKWTSVGLGGGGGQFTPSISPVNPNLMTVSCDMGGVYRTKDGGKTWTMLNFRQLRSSINAPTIFHPTNENIMWDDDKNNLKQSTDGGDTWHTVWEMPSRPADLHIPFASNTLKILVALGKNGLYLSSDGTNFAKVEGIDEAFYIAGKNKIVVASHSKLWISTDAGTTFKQINNLPALGAINNVAITNNSIYILENIKLWVSTDAGNNWTTLLESANYDRGEFRFVRSGGNNIWVTTTGGGKYQPSVLLSTDKGKNFKPVFFCNDSWDDKRNLQNGWLSLDLNCGWGGGAIGFNIAPNNPAIALWTDYGRTLITTNAGQSWAAPYTKYADVGDRAAGKLWQSRGLEVTSSWDIYIPENNAEFLNIAYTDIGGAYSSDGGKKWRSTADGGIPREWFNTTYDFAYDKENKILWGAFSGRHDIPGGWSANSWKNEGAGGVAYSSDNGKHWTALKDKGLPNRPVTSIAIDFTSPKDNRRIYAAAWSDGIWRTNDGGLHWKRVCMGLSCGDGTNSTNGPNTHVVDVQVHKDGTVFALKTKYMRNNSIIKNDAGLWRSTNYGDSWEFISDNISECPPRPSIDLKGEHSWADAISFTLDDKDVNHIFVGAQNANNGKVQGGLYETKDGGKTWERIHQTYAAFRLTISKHYPDRYYLATSGNGVLISDNKGASWTEIQNFPFSNPTRISESPQDKQTIWVNTFGGGVWKGILDDETDVNDENLNAKTFVITPNPAADYIDIHVVGDHTRKAPVRVYDVLGSVVLSSPACSAVTPSEGGDIRVDVSGLAAGVYFVRVDGKMYKFVKM